jgi:hypothetical protein
LPSYDVNCRKRDTHGKRRDTHEKRQKSGGKRQNGGRKRQNSVCNLLLCFTSLTAATAFTLETDSKDTQYTFPRSL